MKSAFLFVLMTSAFFVQAQPAISKSTLQLSPLSEYDAAWNEPKYLLCNTAAKVSYMNEEEKKVIYILNLARTNPALFCKSVVKKYATESDDARLDNSTYLNSLIKEMNKLDPLNLLQPDPDCYKSANCHAVISGNTGYIGHTRSGTCLAKRYYNGECCDYGHDKALDIVMSLLIDYDVPSLGHRMICFSPYLVIGVSIQPHKVWTYTAVLDLHY